MRQRQSMITLHHGTAWEGDDRAGEAPRSNVGAQPLERDLPHAGKRLCAARRQGESMQPLEWLELNVEGFDALPNDDRTAIMHFSLLWSLFESSALQTQATPAAILDLAGRLAGVQLEQEEEFQEAFDYFRNRYFPNGRQSTHFEHLNFRPNDRANLVEAVLKGEDDARANVIGAVLLIIWRLRNNLFHGIKWKYGIRGQLGNFSHANNALMASLSAYARL